MKEMLYGSAHYDVSRAREQYTLHDTVKAVAGREFFATEIVGIYPRPKWLTLVPSRIWP